MKPFAAFDIDGTLIRWQLYHAIFDNLAQAVNPEVREQVKAARMEWKKRTQPDAFRSYEHQLVDAYKAMLTTLSVEQVKQASDEVFETYKDQVYRYTRDLIVDLKNKGYFLLAVSGSHQEIVEKIAEYYGFDDCVGSHFVQSNGNFTGENISPVGRKDEVLRQLIKKHSLSTKDSIAVGDSSSDIAMLEIVEQPIVFNGEKSLIEHAREQGWQIIVERKNVIYKLNENDGQYILA